MTVMFKMLGGVVDCGVAVLCCAVLITNNPIDCFSLRASC